MESTLMLAGTGYLAAAVLFLFWRLDLRHWDRERSRLLDRVQAGTLRALDDHREREVAREVYARAATIPAVPVMGEEGNEGGVARQFAQEPPDFMGANAAYRKLME